MYQFITLGYGPICTCCFFVYIYNYIHVLYIFEEPFTTCTCVPTSLTEPELLYLLQGGCTPLHHAANGGHAMCVERLLSAPGIDVNIKDRVS